LSCQNKRYFRGSWKPFQVTIWNNYHNDSLLINLNSRQLYYREDKETLALMTPSYKDSLLELLSRSSLTFNEDSTFIMEDYGFFVQALSDTAWHKVRNGNWSFAQKDSIFTLLQPNGLKKCYKMLEFKNERLTIGELYECEGGSITDIVLTR
jgi:hypothetical protein